MSRTHPTDGGWAHLHSTAYVERAGLETVHVDNVRHDGCCPLPSPSVSQKRCTARPSPYDCNPSSSALNPLATSRRARRCSVLPFRHSDTYMSWRVYMWTTSETKVSPPTFLPCVRCRRRVWRPEDHQQIQYIMFVTRAPWRIMVLANRVLQHGRW